MVSVHFTLGLHLLESSLTASSKCIVVSRPLSSEKVSEGHLT